MRFRVFQFRTLQSAERNYANPRYFHKTVAQAIEISRVPTEYLKIANDHPFRWLRLLRVGQRTALCPEFNSFIRIITETQIILTYNQRLFQLAFK